ncbi:undecaprenyl-diphosphatase [Caulobacter sp. CCUG 60055]|uniref:undecaprenyl-diphosphate phosphatase n=1 Tax=Caulobacter sp. CCUG 60055 TaxID=2100090 RepID=UPI001FA6E75F|nr:undecaprenyl-diphosphate phosphatase [Caulobacter sp. CCUG 60055]MBQ1543644.1 undecaprenyl-diphosphate phosphatase [Caulobacteraceae bacterium]MCI3181542.1 undecaprenyl-diphosphatase [Caulobacter sp. CCUG 60055]
MNDWLIAVILGLIEGLTEFIPVSSTGHLILAKDALGLTDAGWDTFIVLIQLGAILAVVLLYFQRLWLVATRLGHDPRARHFVLSVLVAFLPAVVLGVALHDIIKGVFFESPKLICWSLILGGLVLLALDRWPPKPTHDDAMRYPLLTSLGIGFFQCLAMIPGVSRSGATIVGALLLKADKRSAAEFSFFLAMPTMAGAFAYDLFKNRHNLDLHHGGLIAVGFVVAFLSGLVVVRALLDFVAKRGFAPFAWWRIVIGAGGLIALALTGR